MWILSLISAIFLALAVYVACHNLWLVIQQSRGKKVPSLSPFVGSFFLLLSYAFDSHSVVWPYAWCLLVLDIGVIPYFLLAIFALLREAWRYSKRKRLLHLLFESEICTGSISLFSNNKCILKWALISEASSGSMIMKVEEFIEGEFLHLSLQELQIKLRVIQGGWELEHEEGWSFAGMKFEGCSFEAG